MLLQPIYLLACLYESTGRTFCTHHGVTFRDAQKVKVFKSLYVLNLWVDVVDTLPDVDLHQVKVTDFEVLS